MNWFLDGGADYARFRPDYPAELARWLAGLCPSRASALDVGCGSGQLTGLLAEHFSHVMGMDPSADQLVHARQAANITYLSAAAESLPLPDAGLDLLTVAQAAHWFDLPRFYGEARRVLKPGGILALITYAGMRLEAGPDQRLQEFYGSEIGPYWPPERALVENGYRDLAFPFAEIPAPALAMRKQWDLAQVLGYCGTWSATKRALADGQQAMLARFGREMGQLWGDAARPLPVAWPLSLRVGRL